MPETVTVDGQPAAKGAATVSASALAAHLDCSRAYVGKLEADGVIQRQGDGFDLDAARVAYLRFLRRERQRSSRHEADAAHTAAKAELLQIKIADKRGQLVERDRANELIDGIAGVVLTHLSGWPARLAGHDFVLRRKAEGLVRELRTEIAQACTKIADEVGEPPLAEQECR